MIPSTSPGNVSARLIKDAELTGYGLPQSKPDKDQRNKRFADGTGIILCSITWQKYGDAGQHWKDQLTGKNLLKWGKIYIDANEKEQGLNRREALAPFRDSRRDLTAREKLEARATNRDECPGAMFVWETRQTADVEPLCAVSNQELGRHMYAALAGAVRTAMVKPESFRRRDMQWFQVIFEFR